MDTRTDDGRWGGDEGGNAQRYCCGLLAAYDAIKTSVSETIRKPSLVKAETVQTEK